MSLNFDTLDWSVTLPAPSYMPEVKCSKETRDAISNRFFSLFRSKGLEPKVATMHFLVSLACAGTVYKQAYEELPVKDAAGRSTPASDLVDIIKSYPSPAPTLPNQPPTLAPRHFARCFDKAVLSYLRRTGVKTALAEKRGGTRFHNGRYDHLFFDFLTDKCEGLTEEEKRVLPEVRQLCLSEDF